MDLFDFSGRRRGLLRWWRRFRHNVRMEHIRVLRRVSMAADTKHHMCLAETLRALEERFAHATECVARKQALPAALLLDTTQSLLLRLVTRSLAVEHM